MAPQHRSARDTHRSALAALPPAEWTPYLDAHSGLPGPRGNLELLDVMGDLAPSELLREWASDGDEYRAAVGAAGLGRLVVSGDTSAVDQLRTLAEDPRWRVREGVAMALQRVGDADRTRLHAITDAWADGPPLVQRATVAGQCEPRLLDTRDDAADTLRLLDRVTESLAGLPSARRRDADVRTLRQGLGYCWSVAVAADPDRGFAALDRWALSTDDDVRWVLRENLRKTRLTRADPVAAARLASLLT